jgi:hypothetical protein
VFDVNLRYGFLIPPGDQLIAQSSQKRSRIWGLIHVFEPFWIASIGPVGLRKCLSINEGLESICAYSRQVGSGPVCAAGVTDGSKFSQYTVWAAVSYEEECGEGANRKLTQFVRSNRSKVVEVTT